MQGSACSSTDNAGRSQAEAQERMQRADPEHIPGESNQLALADIAPSRRTRVLMTDAQLQSRFWCYAAQYFCHIYNRSPHSSNPDNKSPYEMWYGKKPPKLKRLRVFGADCVVHLPVSDRENKSKLDAAGVPAKYLGVPPNNAAATSSTSRARTPSSSAATCSSKRTWNACAALSWTRPVCGSGVFPLRNRVLIRPTPQNAVAATATVARSPRRALTQTPTSRRPRPRRTTPTRTPASRSVGAPRARPRRQRRQRKRWRREKATSRRRRTRSGRPRIRQRLRLRLPRDVSQPVLRRREPHR